MSLAALAGVVTVIGIGVVVTISSQRTGGHTVGQTPWSRLGTSDVHSLAFAGEDPESILFGHHEGIDRSRDGGRTWESLATNADAMGMRPAADGSIVIAGHDLLTASNDGGNTWQPIAADLPSLDIHGFARDPGDPARMWAALATGGLWESVDSGARWSLVRQDNVLAPFAVRVGSTTRLLGVDASGFVQSDDGGRTWAALTTPPTYPMTSLTASSDGRVIYAGSPDGIYRSDDAGQTWGATSSRGSALAIATSADGETVVVVSRATEFFRSPDGGKTWPGPG